MILVTLQIGDVIEFFITNIGNIFRFMENIEFLGTNLLKFSITLLIINAMIPILLTLLKNGSNNVGNAISERRKENKND